MPRYLVAREWLFRDMTPNKKLGEHMQPLACTTARNMHDAILNVANDDGHAIAPLPIKPGIWPDRRLHDLYWTAYRIK